MDRNREKKPVDSAANSVIENLSMNIVFHVEKYTKNKVSVLNITFMSD